MAQRRRLDAELVRRNLARSREHASELVQAGRVSVAGSVATKPATQVDPAVAIVLAAAGDDAPDYASRGGHKLAGALDHFAADGGLDVAGRRALDAGASTGGFTDVLLRRGVAHVVAVDVGYGQLAWHLRQDPRVTVLERTNIRHLEPGQVAPPPDLVVADLSFISLRTVLPVLAACTRPGGELLPMVKPQFEVGRGRLGSGGVVRDPELRRAALGDVATAARDLGLVLRDAVASPLPGPSGNVEFFLRLVRDPRAVDAGDAVLDRAVAEGPR